jgi:hypothetical protein
MPKEDAEITQNPPTEFPRKLGNQGILFFSGLFWGFGTDDWRVRVRLKKFDFLNDANLSNHGGCVDSNPLTPSSLAQCRRASNHSAECGATMEHPSQCALVQSHGAARKITVHRAIAEPIFPHCVSNN